MSQIAHSVRGRLRMRYPASWLRSARGDLEQRVRGVPGVRRARASELTGSLLIDYDPFALAEGALLDTLDAITRDLGGTPGRQAGAPAAKLDVRRNALLTLVGTTGALGLAALPLPAPLRAGLVVAGGLPTLARAG